MGFKIKIFIGIIIIFILFIIGIIPLNTSAEEQIAKVSIVGEPTYKLKNEIIKNNIVVGRSYLIEINFYNSGNIKSEELAVNISDEEGFSLKKYVFVDSGETKVVSFNWSTMLNRNQIIKVRYLPADLDAIWTKYNHGSTEFTIKIDEKEGLPATSTPGFELLLIINSILIFSFLKKRKK